MKTMKIKRSEISIDGGTQQREKINLAVVNEYAESMRCGAAFPPVSVFFDGAQTWLADGFHRFHARGEAEIDDILCDVYTGTKRDALLFSASANSMHGLRPTNADKIKSVMVLLDDAEWTKWTNRDIAKHCKVTHTFVNKLRKNKAVSQVEAVSTQKDKPASTADVTNENLSENEKLSTDSPEKPAAKYDPRDDQLDELRDLVRSLAEENESLKSEIENRKLPPSELEVKIKKLEIIIRSITKSRDQYMTENASMKTQMAIYVRERKKSKK